MSEFSSPVPADYDDLYRKYSRYIKGLLATRGIPAAHIEDVCQTMLAKCIEKDILSQYQPIYTPPGGSPRAVKFTSYLGAFVIAYIPHLRNRLRIHYERELAMDSFQEDSLCSDEVIERLDLAALIEVLRKHMAKVATLSRSPLSMPKFFDAVLVQILETGEINTRQLSEDYDVAYATMLKWLARMRQEASAALEEVS